MRNILRFPNNIVSPTENVLPSIGHSFRSHLSVSGVVVDEGGHAMCLPSVRAVRPT